MSDVRVTGHDGTSRVVTLSGNTCVFGRNADNDVVLAARAVSGRHCRLDLQNGGFWLTDLQSTNGTWINHHRAQTPTAVHPHDRIDIGPFHVELLPVVPMDSPGGPRRPLLRASAPKRRSREQRDRLHRLARHWDDVGRPARKLLRGAALLDAKRYLAAEHDCGELERIFVGAAVTAVWRRRAALIGTLCAVTMILAAAGHYWRTEPKPSPTPAPPQRRETQIERLPPARDPKPISAHLNGPLVHRVIPFETLAHIARRYAVDPEDVARSNLINPDDPQLNRDSLVIEAPNRRPLPQQRMVYATESGETWQRVSARFEVPVAMLRRDNPDLHGELRAGQTLVIWIDPKPYRRRKHRKPLPRYHIDRGAMSIGAPNAGRLVDGVQMPRSTLYTLRKPFIMYGSAYAISNLQRGIAMFRQDIAYDGALIVADISKRGGGRYGNHVSHQSGRDVDLWLPTTKGVYKRKYLGDGKSRPRKPLFDEVDWYATWGLVRALIQTQAVKYIFLQWEYQEYVYRAAVAMGTTAEELDTWIQWPRSRHSSHAIFRHSDRHTSHIHIRFACAPWESECRGRAVVEE